MLAKKPSVYPRLPAGTLVQSSYRVPPFLGDETLRVVQQAGPRVFCRSENRPKVEGWLDASTLTKINPGSKGKKPPAPKSWREQKKAALKAWDSFVPIRACYLPVGAKHTGPKVLEHAPSCPICETIRGGRPRSNPEDAGDILEALLELGQKARTPFSSKDAAKALDTMTELELGKTLWFDKHQRLTPELFLRHLNDRLDCHGVEALFAGEGELLTRPGDFHHTPVAEYLNTGDTYNLTVLYDYENKQFMVTTYGDFVEKWESEHLDDLEVKLTNRDEDGEDWVMAEVSGPSAESFANRKGSIEGSSWESAGDGLVYTLFLNRPGLVEDLEKEGYRLNLDAYSPPDDVD